ncbi:hypothetical protein PNBC_13955 [Paenibacillus crassostreae]|uniref:YetF C-terminal domain-containing protein n=2 Tax=Paenibacillus crassostreae TaxID=1763538 RepID=A0A167CJB8_9BACL|nr:DUF421 domain-containing protein [Paenibacillus crassostreae]AOZ94596.1 hypothetical protein LPB68_06335 [Paenibacillus crassostreae]OAB73264.1 hypothetical protein PNBC_13955 [Paenibacillus crassostreae]
MTYILRTLLMYVVIYATIRIMGKREIGKLSIFDLVISIMIAEIAVFVIDDIKRPVMDGIIPMVTLVLLQIVIAQIGLKSRKLRLLFDGKPTVLISNGKIHREAMKNQRYNLDDLMFQIRQKDIDNIANVEFAILETTGQLTVFPKEITSESDRYSKESYTRSKKLKSRKKILIPRGKVNNQGLPIPLIMDGRVMDENLILINKSRFWLKNEIQSKGVSDFKDIFLCSIDHNNQIYIDLKDNKFGNPSK